MTAAEAAAFITEHNLAGRVAGIVDDAPPLPDGVADIFATAKQTTARTRAGEAVVRPARNTR